MSKSALFRKIVDRSVLMGLQAGAALGFAAACCLMFSLGFWAVIIGLGYGCVLGAVLGLINGLLLAWLICRFFFPYAQNSALRRVTQTGSVAVSLLITALAPVLTSADSGADRHSVETYLAIALPLVGVAAWWGSWRVDIWYEALSGSDAEAAA
jgi:hypothetical protein